MWSLTQKLTQLAKHLPDGYSAHQGVRSLFPPASTASLSALNQYVAGWKIFSASDGITSDMQAFVGADGAGRWFYGWLPSDSANDGQGIINLRSQAGFVFLYSNDGLAHGYVDTSRPAGTGCNCGDDSWIKAHWPQALPHGIHNDFQAASGFESLGDESNIWSGAGFKQLASLAGESCECDTHYPPDPPIASLGALPGIEEDNTSIQGIVDGWYTWWM